MGYTDDLFEALDLQESLQTLYTGWTVFHAFLGEQVDDIDALKVLLQTVFAIYRFRISPYTYLQHLFSHGYLRGEQEHVQPAETPQRSGGRGGWFYQPIKNWNLGKQAEFQERRTFDALEIAQ